ncbi:hypothetical protein [Streptomyces sp. NPDC048172]|uniref:hypothetical protein n=1 Tax=Streptomyces sp. NPDC048172 TaxID=3365505 RepID=UPI003716814B
MSYLTIRISRDSGRTYGPERRFAVDQHDFRPALTERFPPCRCPDPQCPEKEHGAPPLARWCFQCQGWSENTILVAVVETGSGPGGMVYACRAHAREFARGQDAPDWLKAEFRNEA